MPQPSFPRIALTLACAALALIASPAEAGRRRSSTPPPELVVTTPANGSFTTDTSVEVSGHVSNASPEAAQLSVNEVAVPVQADGSWSYTLPLDPAELVHPVFVELLLPIYRRSERRTVISGASIADGDFSPMGVALRISDAGLDQLEPQISSQVDLDPATLMPIDSVVIEDYCAIPGLFGCWGRIDAVVAAPAPSLSGFGIGLDAQTDQVDALIEIQDLRIDLDLQGSGLAPSCGLRLTASETDMDGSYELQPKASMPSEVDVVQIGAVNVSFQNFGQEFTSGICDFPLLGDLIQLIIGNLRGTVEQGFEDFLNTPDASGDKPVAAAIETALAGIEIAGPIGQAIGVNLETPLFDVFEDDGGLTLDADARITALMPHPAAEDQLASFHRDEAFPSFGVTTPELGLPYDLAICISTSAFNQLLKAEVESGLLITDITELDLGSGPFPITAQFLAQLIPAYGTLPPATLLAIELRPKLAPFLSGADGPAGEIAELRIPHLWVQVRNLTSGSTNLTIAFDAAFGLELDFEAGELSFALGAPDLASVNVDVLYNQVGAAEADLEGLLVTLLPSVLSTLTESLASFPLPDFLGLALEEVEVSRNGEYLSIFTDLAPASP